MLLTALRGKWQRLKVRHRVTAVAAAIGMVTLGIGWYVAAEDRICLVADGQATVMRTRAACVEDLLALAGVSLAEGDTVKPGTAARIKEGLTIQVYRAFPVELVVGGKQRTVKTIAVPVGKLLAACRVTLGENDRVSPGLAQEVKPGQTIKVIRLATKEVVYREEVAPKVVVREDANLDRGTRRVIKEGTSGLVEKTARLSLEDGAETEREVLATKWLRWPDTRIVAVGTRPIVHTFVTSRGQVVRYTDKLTMTATAYYPGPESCGVNAKGLTRTGARATYGVVAVDPRVIKLGTRLYVEGYGFATALDTGSAIKGGKIDLCYDTYREAYMYGKRKIDVYIIAK